MLNLYVLYGAQSWIRGLRRFGGTRSRRIRNYLDPDARIYETLWVSGYGASVRRGRVHLRMIYAALASTKRCSRERDRGIQKSIKCIKRELDIDSYRPAGRREIRQSWGSQLNQSRTHYYVGRGAIATSASKYDYPNNQDMPLTVDLPPLNRRRLRGRRSRVIPGLNPEQCYVLSDTEKDPYGKNSKHHPPLFWAAAQKEDNALAMVLYEPKSFKSLETHLVLPIHGGSKIILNEGEIVEGNDILSLASRKLDNHAVSLWSEGLAVSFRILEAYNQRGQDAPVSFHSDREIVGFGPFAEKIEAVRLTISHHLLGYAERDNPLTNPGALIWVCLRECDETKFGKSDRLFRDAKLIHSADSVLSRVDHSRAVFENPVREWTYGINAVAWPNWCGLFPWRKREPLDLRIRARSEDGRQFAARITPRPSTAVLALRNEGDDDGVPDKGRRVLELLAKYDGSEVVFGGFFNKHRECIESADPFPKSAPAVRCPAYWSAADGYLQNPMREGSDATPAGRSFVWLPPRPGRRRSDVGQVAWSIPVLPGSYYLWGRVYAPSFRRRSFRVRISHTEDIQCDYLAPWIIKPRRRWAWIPLDLNEFGEASYPSKIDVAGPCDAKKPDRLIIQLFARQAGTKIDAVYITTNPDLAPSDEGYKRFIESR